MKVIQKTLLEGYIKCLCENGDVFYELYSIDQNGKEYISLDRKDWQYNLPLESMVKET